MTTNSSTRQRRLRVIEIAVLADEHELPQACDRLCTALNLSPEPDAPALPHAMSWYDAADLPRSIQAELLAEIDCGQDDRATGTDPQRPVRRVCS